jgi:hypothetical protein
MILIRGTDPGARVLIEEVWQLWRYLGGYKREGVPYTGDMLGTRPHDDVILKSIDWQTGEPRPGDTDPEQADAKADAMDRGVQAGG